MENNHNDRSVPATVKQASVTSSVAGPLASLMLLDARHKAPADDSMRTASLFARGLGYKPAGTRVAGKKDKINTVKPLGFTVYHDPAKPKDSTAQAANGSAPL